MKHLISIFLIAGTMVLGSCQPHKPAVSEVPSFDLLSSTDEVDDISEYIDEVEVIRIDADSLLYIWPGKLLINGEKIIVLSGGEVYQMDSKGEVLGQVGKVGRGPGEYLSISDICYSTDKSRILCQDSQNRVHEYDSNSLEYITTVDPGIVGNSSNAIVPYGKGGFSLLVNNPSTVSDFENDFYCLKCYDKDGHLEEEMLKREDFNILTSFTSNSIQGPGDTYYLSFIPSEGTFYKDSCGVISPFAHLSFGQESLPFRYAISGDNNPWEKVSEIFESKYFKCISALCATDNLMYCYAFGGKNSRYHFLIDPKCGKGIRWRATNFASVMAAIASDDEYFYCCYTPVDERAKQSPYYFEDILRVSIDKKLGYSVCGEDDNPAIVKVKYSFPR